MCFVFTTNGVWPYARVVSYLERKLLTSVDLDSLECHTSHHVDYSDHRHICAQLVLGAWPKKAGHWKFNMSIPDSRYFR